MEELLQRKTQLSQTHELSEKKVGIKFEGKMERGWRDLTFHLSLKPFAQNLSNSNCFHLMCSSKMSKMRWSTNLAFFGSWSAVAARLGGAQATLPRAIHNMDNMDSISTTGLQVCVIKILLICWSRSYMTWSKKKYQNLINFDDVTEGEAESAAADANITN